MRYFCITHRPLPWPLPDFMEPVSSVPAGEGVTDVSGHYPEVHGLSEYATLFAVRRMLQDSWGEQGPPPAERMVGIGHYRRFAVTQAVGIESDIYRVVDPERFAQLPDDLFLTPPGWLLHPAATRFPVPVVSQYGSAHVVRDLLHFMAIAVDLGVVDGEDVARFLGGDVMIAAPTVGIWPSEWLFLVLEALEAVATAFQESVGVDREGYQRRVLGFCCERLHALLVQRLLASWPRHQVMANRLLVVSDDGTYRTGG